jgi:plastocyanin
VAIQDYLFSPYTITIYAGQSITWMNNGQEPHTVNADDNSWFSSILNHGDSYSHTFATPGTYTYHCAIHAYMHGTVVVIPLLGSTPPPTATPTQAPNTPTDTPIPETATAPATDTPSATDVPTATVTPTSTPTQLAATDTPVPTETLTVTDTPVPASPTDSATAVPPTDTPVPPTTVVPSDTPTEATATETAIDTATAVPPTDTPPATDTATSVPTDTATTTAVPTDMATDTPSPTSTVSSSPVTVTISNFAFSPMTVTIQAGQSVQWVNDDLAQHTSTSDTGSTFAWDTGLIAGAFGSPGVSAPVTFTTPGTFTYHCNVHSFMQHGTVIVN